MKAAALRQVDMDYRAHQQAFLNFAVKATRKVGKGKERPVFSTFKSFFDYEKAIEAVEKPKKKQSRFAGIGKFFKKGGSVNG